MSGLRERKKEATKELLQITALELFRKSGFHNVSMRDLAKACDLSLGTFYNYYTSKEEVLTSIIDRKIGQLYSEWESRKLGQKSQSFADFVETLFTLHIDVLKDFRAHIHILFLTFTLPEGGKLRADAYRGEIWKFTLEHAPLKFASATESEQASHFYWGAYLNFLMLWATDASAGQKVSRAYLKTLSKYLARSLARDVI